MEWKPYQPPPKDPMMAQIEEWHRRQNGGYVHEGHPYLSPDHPAYNSIPTRKFTQEHVRALYKAFTGREPPASCEEWETQREERRREAWKARKQFLKATDPFYNEANYGDEPPDDWCKPKNFFGDK